MKLFAIMCLLAASAASSTAKPTVYFIRHGEKPADDDADGLSALGLQRAQCLRGVFGASSGYDVGHIMAETPSKNGKRARPYDTVKPLADDLGLCVDTSCGRDDGECVKKVVDGYEGQGNILICWEHKALRHLAEALGARNVQKYPGDAYDLIWVSEPDYDKINAIGHEDCNIA